MSNNQDNNFNRAKKLVDGLSAEQKTDLIKEVCKEIDFPLNAGGQIFLNADFVMQVNTGETSLDDLFRAAANRISRERLKSE